jgi:hypothetical protein
MEGMMPPWPLMAIVVSQDPDNYALNVSVKGFLGGQMPSLPVSVLTQGPRDGVRGNFPELPTPGTWGLVVFPSGDRRSGHWLGSTTTGTADASTLAPGLGNTAYESQWAGGFNWRGQDGTTYTAWPDGSAWQMGPTAPAPTRHAVDATTLARTRVAFPMAERVLAPPGAFPGTFTHKSGASVSLSTAGAWTFTSAGGAQIVLEANGTVLVISGGGNPIVASGGDLRALQGVFGNYGGAGQVGLETHIHPQGVDSHGDTEQDTGAPIPGT